jgi:hypothetical protein
MLAAEVRRLCERVLEFSCHRRTVNNIRGVAPMA